MATNTQSLLLPIEGEFPVDPEFRIQPTVQRAAPTANVGWTSRRRYDITNNADEPLANFLHAIDLGLTNGLVTGGLALSSGDDLRIWHQGREIARTLVDWNSGTFTTLCWIVIPYLGVGETMTVDVVYGNSAAGSPPTLIAGDTLPAFDIQTAGANRSTNAKWVYKTERIAANAGKGGWYLTSGTAQPDVRHGVPGAWLPVNTLQSDDDRKQESFSTYEDSGTKYQGRFEARRAAPGALLVGQDNGMDGVAIRLPIGITAVRSDIRWQNLAIGDTDATPIGQVVIVTRNAPSETWKTLYSNTALQATEATIATATYTPAASVKEVAYAIWPQEGNNVDLAARPDRFINAAWYTTLEVHPTAGNVVTTLVPEDAWTPDNLLGLMFWLKADAITGLTDGNTVATWPDSSGNSHDAVNPTGSEHPTYQTNEINGLPVVRFDGTDDDMTIASPGLTKPFVIYTVMRINTGAGVQANDRLYLMSGAFAFVAGAPANDFAMFGGSAFTYSTDTLDSNPHIHGHVFAANGNSTGSFDGVTSTGNAGTNAASGNFVLASSSGTEHLPVDIGEVVAFNGALSLADLLRLEGYLAHKWGLTANLPASHLYKTSAPVQDEIYELASELRVDGGGDAMAVSPYRSILLGNAREQSGVGVPRLACKLQEQIRIFGAERRIEVWNSGLTMKIDDVPIPSYHVVEGVLDENGNTVEQPSLDWLSLMPQVNPLTNPSADTVATGWTQSTTDALMVADPRDRDTVVFNSAPASFTVVVTSNTSGAGHRIRNIADDFLPIGRRQNVVFGADLRTTNVNLRPRLGVVFYDESQVQIGSIIEAPSYTVLAADTWFRRFFAAAVPEGAIYWKPDVEALSVTANQIGTIWFDTVAVNDTEIALLDVATGTLVLTVKWTPRYAYA